MARPLFWINAGEPSGDMHGALLLAALRGLSPHASFIGMGGNALRQAGMETPFRVEDLSVMGITEVLGHLPKIFRMLADIKAALASAKPDAVIVIDAPEFHFRVIRAARALGIPVYYYISPKIWAWREKRAFFIRENVRRLISILPFEQDFYRRFGMEVDYVGNPLVDLVDYPSLRSIQAESGLVGFLPGSRKKEICSLLPQFGAAARILRQRLPSLNFLCIRAPGIDGEFLKKYWPEDVPIEITAPDNRWQLMRRCEMLIAASGTVTLESAIVGTPTLITYKVSPLSFAVGKTLVKVPFMGLPNLILNRSVFPELLQNECDAVPLADAALRWLLPPPGTAPLQAVRKELDEARSLLGKPGAAERAAKVILDDFFR